MKAHIIIAIFHTLKNQGVKAQLTFRDYGHYASLKLEFGKKGEDPTLWSKLYKSDRLIKKLDGIPFNYKLFKHE